VYNHPPPRAIPPRFPIGEPVPPSRRFAAWAVDFSIITAVAVLIGYLTFHRITDMVAHDLPKYGIGKLFSAHGDVAGAATDIGRDAWREAVSYVQQGFVALVFIQFLYQFLCLASNGRTAGKALVGIQVRPLSGAPSPSGLQPPAVIAGIGMSAATLRAAITTVAETGLYALACVVLVSGHLTTAVLLWLIAVAGLIANGLPILTNPDHRSLGDRVSGTFLAHVERTFRPGGNVSRDTLN
jgi:uncharacterized RDD family membrane protein YckC